MAGKAKAKSGSDRDAKVATRKPARQIAPDATRGLTGKDVRGLREAVADLQKQTAALDDLVRGLRKQVKRLKRTEPSKRSDSAPNTKSKAKSLPRRGRVAGA